ncbi:MAG: hypothetical protein IPJ74_05985 [Saprospiraceae bacterium]|nr:hypothetical protein [Saprospiraceae bacterium]
MEIFTFKYQLLCEIKILHHFFLDDVNTVFDNLSTTDQNRKLRQYDVRNWLNIVPDTATVDTLGDHRLVYRPTKQGFVILSQTESTDIPLLSLDKLLMRFDLNFETGASAYTALPINVIKAGNPTTYVFGNTLAAANSGIAPSLALAPETYSNSKHYPPGEIVQQAGTNYKALYQSDNQGISVNNVDYWQPLPPGIRYATTSNAQPLPPDTDIDSRFFGRVEISGQSGFGNFNLLTGGGNLQGKTFEIRVNKI